MKTSKEKKWQLLFSFFKKNKLRSVSSILSGMIANIFTVLIPVSLGKYFDLLFGFQSHRAAFLDQLPFSFWDNISEYLKFLIMLIILKTIFQYLQRIQTGILGERFVRSLREQLFRQQLQIRTSVYDDRGTGRYLLRHSGDLKSIQNFLTNGIIRFSTDVFLLLLALLALLWLDKGIFTIILIGFVFTVLVVFILNKTLHNISVKRRNTRSGLLAFVNNQLQSIKTIKAFNKTPTEIKKYDNRSSKLYQIGVRFQKLYQLIFVLVPSLLYLTLVGILYFIYHTSQQSSGSLNTGNTLGFIFLFITILPIFRRIIRVGTVWELGNISLNKLSQVFDLPIENESNNLKSFEFKEGKIEFKNVDFSYIKSSPLFQHLNFTIYPKHFNQIKIGNGEGKSSMIRLLAGLYSPDGGVIEFDGQNRMELKLKSLRKYVSFISDEFPLLGKTVFEVISYSRKAIRKPKVQKVLDEFQRNTPKNNLLSLDDKVMEGGVNLSSSQIKMLYYVRAALSKKPILVIDEPIRNLENNTRKNILRWLKEQANHKTIVLLCRTWNQPSILIENIIKIN